MRRAKAKKLNLRMKNNNEEKLNKNNEKKFLPDE